MNALSWKKFRSLEEENQGMECHNFKEYLPWKGQSSEVVRTMEWVYHGEWSNL